MPSLRERLAMMLRGEVPPPPAGVTLGIKLTQFGEGNSRFEMEVGAKFYNPMGTVHGGIITTLADSAMGIAVASTLGDDETFTTLEVKTNFIRPVYEGKLIADATVIHRGRTITISEATVIDSDSRLVAKCTSTCMILRANSEHHIK